MAPKHAAIVTAAGSSRRFNESSCTNNTKKEFLEIDGKPILCRAIEPFIETEGLCALAVTCRDEDLEHVRSMLCSMTIPDEVSVLVVQGGATRQESVFNGLKALDNLEINSEIEYVSIHDGARPFVTKGLVESCLKAAEVHGGACPCIRITDTLVRVNAEGIMDGRLDRTGVCAVQTPQTFRFREVLEAHRNAIAGKAYTDDTEIFMDHGGKVAYVQGFAGNRKITYAQDLKEATV